MEDASSLKSLVQEVRKRGWNRKPTGRALVELTSHVLVTAFGIAVFITLDVLWIRVLAMVVATVGTMGVLTHTHTASHYAAAEPKWLNELMLYFGYTFFWGISARRRRGVPYHCYTWDQAMWRTFKVLATPKRIEGRLEDLRLPSTAAEPS